MTELDANADTRPHTDQRREAVVPYGDYLQQVERVAALEDELKRLRDLLRRHAEELHEV